MTNNIYNTFINEIEKLKKNKNVKSIIHVGSSKDKIYENCKVNDIDLFIIVEKQEKKQIRKIEEINNVEFDFNYISLDGCYNFINSKTYFFLKIKDGKLLYDENNIGRKIITLCEERYNEGPDKVSIEDKRFQANQLLDDISRLKSKEEYDEFEYDFLIYIYLTKIIKMYYMVNDAWIPKDKKLLKSLKKQDPTLYKLICNDGEFNKYKKLTTIANYVFRNL
ncbi:hypothetical protein [Terrisporobacter sp.]